MTLDIFFLFRGQKNEKKLFSHKFILDRKEIKEENDFQLHSSVNFIDRLFNYSLFVYYLNE